MKTITIPYNGRTYTLCFTVDSILTAENRHGLNPAELEQKPLTTVLKLFMCAFLAKNPIGKDKAREIYFSLDKKEQLIAALGTMYSEVLSDVLGKESEEESSDKESESEEQGSTWEANW